MKPGAVMLEDTTAAPACSTPKEIVTLEVEDMLVEIDGEGFVCVTCYEIIPKRQYASHQERRGCHSLARPPEAMPDKFSCNTCHRRFRSGKANDFHEPCKAANNNIHAGINRKRHKRLTSATAAENRHRDVQISTKAADTIVTYRP